MSEYMFDKNNRNLAIYYFAGVFIMLAMFTCMIILFLHDDTKNKNKKAEFIVVEKCNSYNIVYNSETKVMYSVSTGMYNSGTLTPLLNPDGTPMLYEETKNKERE